MMTRDGKYTASYAAALTAVSSVIGPIIPPSIPMILYALVSDASIGYLFLGGLRSEENTYELQSLMRTSYAAFCLKKKILHTTTHILRYPLSSNKLTAST